MIAQTTQLTKEFIELAIKTNTLEEVYAQEVNRLIRLRYSQSAENAIFRHKLNGTGDVEFAEFNAYCEECKVIVKERIKSLQE